MTTLGFRNRTRTNSGWVIWLDRVARKRIHELMSTYGVDAPSAHLPSQELIEPCDFCKGEDLQCPETAPVGLASEPTTENGAADKPTSQCGERSEHSEPENGTEPLKGLIESEADRVLFKNVPESIKREESENDVAPPSYGEINLE